MQRLLWGVVLVLVLGAAPAWAGDTIQLRQSNGTTTDLGGDGDAAKVTCDNCDSGGGTQSTTLASGVVTNTTSTAVAGVRGTITFWGQVVCSAGACTQTQAIYGDVDNDAANGLLLCTLTLSGTTRAQDVCAGATAPYLYYYVVTTATSGTAATGDVYAMY